MKSSRMKMAAYVALTGGTLFGASASCQQQIASEFGSLLVGLLLNALLSGIGT